MALQRAHISGLLVGLFVSVLILFSALGGAIADRMFVIKPLNKWFPSQTRSSAENSLAPLIVPDGADKSDVIVAVAEHSQPSVVTVAIKKDVPQINALNFSPFGFFQTEPGRPESVQRDIGTGFVVDEDRGFVVTNRHVVSDVNAQYKLIDKDGNEHEVEKIYRDPVNDLAILKTSAKIPALPLADSDKIRIGETTIAIGTALGEFRQTVTTGIVSGLGRGIDASDGFSSERIDNLIQTDAAINPGNSGGPLFNDRGEVIGVNVAVAQAENIGFAIPINVVKNSLTNFDQTGEFQRALLGVQYKMIPKETALLNDVPEGAYVTAILPGTTAEALGLQLGDLIIQIDGKRLADEKGGLAAFINRKKVGDTITLQIWRNGQLTDLQGELKTQPSQ